MKSESEVAQLCPTLCDPMDCSLPGSSVHGIFQARVLECICISSSRGSFQPRDRTQVSRIVGRCFYWKEQVSQDGVIRLSWPTASCTSARFVNNGFVTAESTFSTVHARDRYLLGHGLLCEVGIHELHPRSGGIYCCFALRSVGSAVRGENIVSAAETVNSLCGEPRGLLLFLKFYLFN